MLYNEPMALYKSEIYKSTIKEICNTVALTIVAVSLCAYCIYLVSQLPLPL